jgi:hypothetical protein
VVRITQRRARHRLSAHRRILIRGSSHKTSHNLQMPFSLIVRLVLNCTASRRRWQASQREKTLPGEWSGLLCVKRQVRFEEMCNVVQ